MRYQERVERTDEFAKSFKKLLDNHDLEMIDMGASSEDTCYAFIKKGSSFFGGDLHIYIDDVFDLIRP